MSLREPFQDQAAQAETLPVIRTAQIIWAGLLIGPAVFAAIVFAMPTAKEGGEIGIVTIVMALFTLGVLPLRAAVPALLVRQQVDAIGRGDWSPPQRGGHVPAAPGSELGKLAVVYQTRLIVASALLEGAAFGNLMAFMLERSALALTLAGLAWLGMLLEAPSHPRFLAWAERQRQRMEEARLLRSEK